jgi:hypothetical protein
MEGAVATCIAACSVLGVYTSLTCLTCMYTWASGWFQK